MIHTLATDLSTAVLNSEEDVNDLLETYFSNLHPWVPMIHKSALQNNVQGDDGKHENKLVLQAMLIGASRYNDQRKSPPDLTAERLQQACNHTLLMANQSLEIKNLQALIILAFKYASSIPEAPLGQSWTPTNAGIAGRWRTCQSLADCCLPYQDGTVFGYLCRNNRL
jgi:hypothetical protein